MGEAKLPSGIIRSAEDASAQARDREWAGGYADISACAPRDDAYVHVHVHFI